MDLMYCERCHCFYEEKEPEVGGYVLAKIKAVDVDHINVDEIGLCPKCMSGFIDWLSKTDENEEVTDGE